MEATRCPECGNVYDRSQGFCPRCGRVTSESDQTVGVPPFPRMSEQADLRDVPPDRLLAEGFGMMSEDRRGEGFLCWWSAAKAGILPDDETYRRMVEEVAASFARSGRVDRDNPGSFLKFAQSLADRDFALDLLDRLHAELPDVDGWDALRYYAFGYLCCMVSSFSMYTDLRDQRSMVSDGLAFFEDAAERGEGMRPGGDGIAVFSQFMQEIADQMDARLSGLSEQELEDLGDRWVRSPRPIGVDNLNMAIMILAAQQAKPGKIMSRFISGSRRKHIDRYLDAYLRGP